jgi:hypothetical protein
MEKNLFGGENTQGVVWDKKWVTLAQWLCNPLI